jgi:hypothetical protein
MGLEGKRRITLRWRMDFIISRLSRWRRATEADVQSLTARFAQIQPDTLKSALPNFRSLARNQAGQKNTHVCQKLVSCFYKTMVVVNGAIFATLAEFVGGFIGFGESS